MKNYFEHKIKTDEVCDLTEKEKDKAIEVISQIQQKYKGIDAKLMHYIAHTLLALTVDETPQIVYSEWKFPEFMTKHISVSMVLPESAKVQDDIQELFMLNLARYITSTN